MKLRIKRFAATSAALLLALCVLAQPTATVQWSDSTAAVGDGVYEITFTGRILDGWHTYDLHSGFSSTVIAFEPSEGVELMGDPFEKVAAERRFDEIFGEEIGEYEGEIVLGELGRDRTRARAVLSRRSSPLRRLEHKTFYFDVVGHDVLPISQAFQRVL